MVGTRHAVSENKRRQRNKKQKWKNEEYVFEYPDNWNEG